MSPEEQTLLRQLLTQQRVLALGLLVEGAPIVGLLPFAAQPDLSAVYVHASALARHTAGLYEQAGFSVLIHLPDQPQGDPLQIPRVTLQGTVRVLVKSSPEYRAARGLYIARFPDSRQTFELGDFSLYQLQFKEGRFVAGFARAYNLTADTLRRLAEQP
jgi:putative heme iron utilization protein